MHPAHTQHAAVDVTQLGKASIKAKTLSSLPSRESVLRQSARPAGSRLPATAQRGHEAVIYDMREALGGKISALIPSPEFPMKSLGLSWEGCGMRSPRQPAAENESGRSGTDQGDYDFVVIAVVHKSQGPTHTRQGEDDPGPGIPRLSKLDQVKVGRRWSLSGRQRRLRRSHRGASPGG